ncbi:adenosine deaminase [Nitzschia inconspicua]|uniref:Adenosine deaminase n=1 Tax=Nitzschia inconspicua TaxID=303405 RepID=A0A9K3LJD4_9STRA|nr:adenosine deaminase [Nitzschia inconspicua]
MATPTDDHQENHMQILRQMPKVELHAHLNGSIRETTLFDLARERNIQLSSHHFSNDLLPGVDHSMYNVRPRSLQDCFAMFAEISTVVDDLPSIRRVAQEMLEDFAAEGCVYLEIRSTPKALLLLNGSSKLATKRDYCETVLQVMKEFQKLEQDRYNIDLSNGLKEFPRLPLVCRLIISVDRSNDVMNGWENIQLAIELKKEYPDMVVGVDLGGNPLKREFSDFRACFEAARQGGLFVTLHCAEVPCSDEEKESSAYQDANAILDFVPDRLGHALLLPPILQKKLEDLRIPVEACPTSNVMTLELAERNSGGSLLEGLSRHPQLKRWLFETNHPLAISTDDPGVFHTTATKELVLLQKAYSLTNADLQKIVEQSMDYAFANQETKYFIKQRIKDRFQMINEKRV